MRWVWLAIGVVSLALMWVAYFVGRIDDNPAAWGFLAVELVAFYKYRVETDKQIEGRSE